MCSCAAGWVWTGGRGLDSKPQWWSGRSGPEVAHCCGFDHRTSSWITRITPSLNQLWRLERCTAERSPNITINRWWQKEWRQLWRPRCQCGCDTKDPIRSRSCQEEALYTLKSRGSFGQSTTAGRDQNQITLNLSPPTARSPRHIITYFLEIGSPWLFLKKNACRHSVNLKP